MSTEEYLKANAPNLYKAIINKNLWFVRSTEIESTDTVIRNLAEESKEEYFSIDDVINLEKITFFPKKPFFNQSINLLVLPFAPEYVWDCRKYIFVAPVSEFIGELIMGTHQDYLTMGSHIYTEESYLLVPNDDVERIRMKYPRLRSTIVGYDYPVALSGKEGFDCIQRLKPEIDHTTPRQAVEELFDRIEREKGIEIWRAKNQTEKPNSIKPIIHGSNSGDNEFSYRVNSAGKRINIDTLLKEFRPLRVADGNSYEATGDRAYNMIYDMKTPNKYTGELSKFSLYQYVLRNEDSFSEAPVNSFYEYYTSLKIARENEFNLPLNMCKEVVVRYNQSLYNKLFNLPIYYDILFNYRLSHPENNDILDKYLDKFSHTNGDLLSPILLSLQSVEGFQNIILTRNNYIEQYELVFVNLTGDDDEDIYKAHRTAYLESFDNVNRALHEKINALKAVNGGRKSRVSRKNRKTIKKYKRRRSFKNRKNNIRMLRKV